MNSKQEDHLTNEEKNLIAMGAGCRTCADKFHGIALSLKIPEKEMCCPIAPASESASACSCT
jgi:hypothetical protein